MPGLRFPGSRILLPPVAGLALVLALTGCGDGGDEAGGRADQTVDPAALTTNPRLTPGFSWNQSDYVLRCRNRAVTATVRTPEGWRARIGRSEFRSGEFESRQRLRAGRSFSVTFAKPSGARKRFHVRCLPAGFPRYRLQRIRPGGPRLTMVQMRRYAVAFDRGGVPVWWYHASGDVNNAQFMGDGTFSYVPVNGFRSREFQVRRLDGRLVRILEAANGLVTDVHDLIRLPNGNYMLGAHRDVEGVDLRRFGGPAAAKLDTAQVQELTPAGRLVWKWDAWPRIRLAETGRWWKDLRDASSVVDVHHWNSVDRRGNRVLMSFRHLDAILMIDRRSGRILWKLGGTRTPRSLKVRRDPRGNYPLGGQHDARFAPGKTITLLDNATGLEEPRPRAVRYRIQPRRRTATMVRQVTDPKVRFSIGFASADLLPGGQWVAGWGAIGRTGIIGGYTRDGKPAYRLITPGSVSYRANPVTGEEPSIPTLRRAMERMAALAARRAARDR